MAEFWEPATYRPTVVLKIASLYYTVCFFSETLLLKMAILSCLVIFLWNSVLIRGAIDSSDIAIVNVPSIRNPTHGEGRNEAIAPISNRSFGPFRKLLMANRISSGRMLPPSLDGEGFLRRLIIEPGYSSWPRFASKDSFASPILESKKRTMPFGFRLEPTDIARILQQPKVPSVVKAMRYGWQEFCIYII